MTNELVCWKCGASLAALPLPLGRLAECLACRAELHVCRICEFYDPRVAKACREPMAEEVQDKERANFCDYFQAMPDAYRPRTDAEAQAAWAQLGALFGVGSGEAGEGALGKAGPRPETDAAREQLERLFGLEGKSEK
jgi:hypothetical protein